MPTPIDPNESKWYGQHPHLAERIQVSPEVAGEENLQAVLETLAAAGPSSVPDLDAVLIEGSTITKRDNISIRVTSGDGTSGERSISIIGGDGGDASEGGSIALIGGVAGTNFGESASWGGNVSLTAGSAYINNAPIVGAQINLNGGSSYIFGEPGPVELTTRGSSGNPGEVLVVSVDGGLKYSDTITGKSNETGGNGGSVAIYAANDSWSGDVVIQSGTSADMLRSGGVIRADSTDATTTGNASIEGGTGSWDDNLYVGSKVTAAGGTDGENGKVSIYTDGTNGLLGDALISDATSATWQGLVTTASTSPIGNGYVSVFVADTTNKVLYAWVGSDYVKIGEWT